MKITRFALVLFVFGFSAAMPATAGEPAACMPKVEQGWIRLLPGGMPMHAGFGRIENRCSTPVTIVSAKSASYGSVELHESRIVGGVNRMRPLQDLRIAPKEVATLKPGGMHLMLMDPVRPVKAGNRIAIVFALSDGRELVGEFIARKPD